MRRVKVVLQAVDPLSLAGLAGHLESSPDVVLLPAEQRHLADVAVVAVDRLTTEVVTGMRRAATEVGTPVVLVATDLDESSLLTAVECRVVAVLLRTAATADRLLHSVLAAAAGEAIMPPNLLGVLLKDVERLQRQLLEQLGTTSGTRLTPREEEVLRMMAEGLDTAEIATKLSYSERTVKNVIYGVTTRFNLRNRPHAVAYAVRCGLI
ncbi:MULTISPECIES: helix-turn-helix transcriptional regulator [Saccharothrix]|uniref:Helix-turn-helix transcriptional regulator n=2 Tax=Saccharothrix TaxID=2071 RepID=A0ABU0X7J9_9PSEU|nr:MULTISPECIES: LuxR C-terminal-related transcriptional regulator [Saccharothrix]MDQ2588105.1 helix-turn-helix transcriptional regulator [Saccharothrix yanglingensis]MDR6593467.1 DNA-binding NarL/FixJ family response regulator [Saccharothrix longispora]